MDKSNKIQWENLNMFPILLHVRQYNKWFREFCDYIEKIDAPDEETPFVIFKQKPHPIDKDAIYYYPEILVKNPELIKSIEYNRSAMVGRSFYPTDLERQKEHED
jgi:hypothetical protein